MAMLTRRSLTISLLSQLAALGLLGACSPDDGGTASSANALSDQFAGERQAASPATTSAGASKSGMANPTAVPPPPLDRKVIVTVTLDVEVSDVGASSLKASTLLEGLSGYVANQQTNFGGPDRPASSTIVMKVPPANVSALLGALSGLGKVMTQSQQSADVTATYVDLESRIAAATASVQRVRLFMSQTANVNELAAIEGELSRRETELEQLLGQQRVLTSQTDMATVTLTLQPTPVKVVAPDDGGHSVGKAWHQGIDALLGAGLVIAIAGAWMAPWLLPALFVAGIWWMIRRRRGASSDSQATDGSSTNPNITQRDSRGLEYAMSDPAQSDARTEGPNQPMSSP